LDVGIDRREDEFLHNVGQLAHPRIALLLGVACSRPHGRPS
jgi:hypothetical protein